MGLDQYAFARRNQLDSEDENIEIMYWRKHADLEGWMSNLYAQRGGSGEFNCVDLQLYEGDILRLEAAHRSLETSQGFFWGQSSQLKVDDTQAFIDKAKEYLAKGYQIIYTSWW